MQRTLAALDPATTAGILISKTFGTQETLLNGAILREWLGDPVHVEKLMAALTENAVRFTRTGGVILRAIAGAGLAFEVEDTGPGMEPAEAARLFEAFTQGDESATRTAEGLGLGLTAAHGLAALMGGKIEIVTAPGAGSTLRSSASQSACSITRGTG